LPQRTQRKSTSRIKAEQEMKLGLGEAVMSVLTCDRENGEEHDWEPKAEKVTGR